MILKDDRLDFIGFSEPKELRFLNIGTIVESEANPNELFKCIIGLGNTIKIQERVVYGVLNALGDIGGLDEIIEKSCYLTISVFIKSLFDASLVKEFFSEAISRKET